MVASAGTIVPGAVPAVVAPALLRGTVRVGRVPAAEELVLDLAPGTPIRAVGVESHSIVTRRREVRAGDPDVVAVAVLERHHRTGRIGRGFATGFGLRRGALASTVAHDAHNIVVAGASSADMAVAVARLVELGGGQVAILDGSVVGEVALPLAGLMSDRPAGQVATQLGELASAAADRLGVTVEAPFMLLSFVALSVIPELRITDGGLFDVDASAFVPTLI